jgi:radical SAM protein with 4Fe4S-binding SPASM domain
MIRVTNYSKHGDVNNFIADNHPRKKEYIEYRKRWNSNKGDLLFLLIETTPGCNLRCPMCIHSLDYTSAPDMSEELFDKVVKNIQQMKIPSIAMNQLNEPLLDKNIFKRIERVVNSGPMLDVHMNTNATLLNRENSEKILESGLTRLLIGFDAYTKDVYERVRVGAKYDKVLSNILNFLELKKKLNKKLPAVRISFVRLSENEKETDKWADFWMDKADYITIQEYGTPVLDDSKNYLIPKDDERSSMAVSEVSCEQPFERAIIRGNGDVLPCCSPFAVKMPLGNIHKNSLEEIWHGKRAKELRKFFIDKSWVKHPVCSKCLSITYNLKEMSNEK